MKKNFIYLCLLFLLCSCSSLNKKIVAVDSYSSYKITGGTYFLRTSTNGMELQQQFFEKEIEDMLLKKGYTRIYKKEYADFNILYNYGIKGPFTSISSYPVPVNPWWSNSVFYDGVYNGYYGPSWVNSIETVNYYVKALELSAYNSNKKVIWQVLGTMKSPHLNMRSSMKFLINGIENYVGINSNKVQYVKVYENEKTNIN